MRVLLVGVVVLLLSGPVAAQGTLARTRIDREPTPKLEPPDEPAARSSSGFEPTDDSAGDLWGGLATFGALAVTSPLWAPAVLLNDDLLRCGYFAGHPYAGGYGGYLIVNPTKDDPEFDSLRTWAVRVGIEDGHDFRSVNRLGTLFALDTSSRWGISSRWDYYRERLTGNASDATTLGDFHVTYRIAQAGCIQIHAGLGGRWRFDEHTVDGGGSFLYSADVFLREPVVFSTSVDLGNLDRKFVVRARASFGLQLSHAELLVGYDFLRFGDVNLQGPFAGLRLWF
jgi:hypothetical protein